MDTKLDYNKIKVMSPFGIKRSPFTENSSATTEFHVPVGSTLPNVIRAFYPGTEVHPINLRSGFMSRDVLKEKDYIPQEEDPFVFHSQSSMSEFFKQALGQNELLNKLAAQLDLPIKKDKDRGIDVIDNEELFKWIRPSHSRHQDLLKNWDAISFITSNQDITKKFCIVRAVFPGWWAASYSGKSSGNLKHFQPAIRCLVKAMKMIKSSPKFTSEMNTMSGDLGDPLDTNVGYPFFTAEVSKEGIPLSKLKVLEQFKGLSINHADHNSMLAAVDKRNHIRELRGFPMAMGPLRRQQPGYKASHMYKYSSIGMVSDLDMRGLNTVRIAWMAPYLWNLLLSPLQKEWKAIRKILPGLFHDGLAKTNRLETVRKAGNKIYIAEADYSNYDRFMPFDVFEAFTDQYLEGHPKEKLLTSMVKGLFHDVPVIWPDSVNGDGQHGWIFKPRDLGLFSGLKVTSEVGTFVNAIVNVQTLLDTGKFSESSMVGYLTQYINSPTGSKFEHFWIQSDDTLLISTDPGALFIQGEAFKLNAAKAGLKGSLQLGDRFLMRHNNHGNDLPVPARVFQNSVSNETPVLDPLIFEVGLVTRSEGLLGQKTFDPFGTGKTVPITNAELIYSTRVLEDLLQLYSTARIPNIKAIEYTKVLLEAANSMKLSADKDVSSTVTLNSRYAVRLDALRRDAISRLAEAELKKMLSSTLEAFNTYFYKLFKDRHMPSSAQVLSVLQNSNGIFTDAMRTVASKENKFYEFAMRKLNIPLNLSDWK